MDEKNINEGLYKLLSLSDEELSDIVSKLSVQEIEEMNNLLGKLEEVDINE